MKDGQKKVRYAVVGLGHISQVAVLPAFQHAGENSELTALISEDSEKLKKLSKEYSVDPSCCFTYDQYEEALQGDSFDAVYIALPNDMHREYSVAAANAGKHILCEKPMATTELECKQMISAARLNEVKLMVAYRLHFEKTNMIAVDLIKEGKIGELRFFNSSFSMQVREGNIRTKEDNAGGPLYDIGIYCINAARYLFQDEPREIVAIFAQGKDPRFKEVEESCGAIMKFPGECIASFVCSFGAADVSRFEIVGTEGRIVLEPAYDYTEELTYTLERGGKKETHKTPKRDQFAPELIHFSDCVLQNKDPRPTGDEGLADLRVIEAITESATCGQMVKLGQRKLNTSKPDGDLIQQQAGIDKPKTVKVESGSKD